MQVSPDHQLSDEHLRRWRCAVSDGLFHNLDVATTLDAEYGKCLDIVLAVITVEHRRMMSVRSRKFTAAFDKDALASQMCKAARHVLKQ